MPRLPRAWHFLLDLSCSPHPPFTVCEVTRRAERLLVALAEAPGEEVGGPALRYVNRLSDFLFVAARYANRKGEADILWVPGQNC